MKWWWKAPFRDSKYAQLVLHSREDHETIRARHVLATIGGNDSRRWFRIKWTFHDRSNVENGAKRAIANTNCFENRYVDPQKVLQDQGR
jgi:hypothetical protein